MSAREMFEKLSYTYIGETTEYYYFMKGFKDIRFLKNTKEIYIEGNINLQELKAINKFYEELGWEE